VLGPMISGPALAATESSSASAPGFGSSSSSASAPPLASKPASKRKTIWKTNEWLGSVTFRYSTFSGLVLSKLIKIEDPLDACMIPTEELDIHAVKIVSGVIKCDGDKYDVFNFLKDAFQQH
jgi:hypothetical protein